MNYNILPPNYTSLLRMDSCARFSSCVPACRLTLCHVLPIVLLVGITFTCCHVPSSKLLTRLRPFLVTIEHCSVSATASGNVFRRVASPLLSSRATAPVPAPYVISAPSFYTSRDCATRQYRKPPGFYGDSDAYLTFFLLYRFVRLITCA